MASRVRSGWEAYGVRPFRRYNLVGTDWWVFHCGHPTAIRPYYIEDPEGAMHLHPTTKLAFTLLEDAQKHTEHLVSQK